MILLLKKQCTCLLRAILWSLCLSMQLMTLLEYCAFHAVLEGEPLDPRGVGYRLLSECELSSQLTTTSTSSSSGGQQQQQQQTELLATWFPFSVSLSSPSVLCCSLFRHTPSYTRFYWCSFAVVEHGYCFALLLLIQNGQVFCVVWGFCMVLLDVSGIRDVLFFVFEYLIELRTYRGVLHLYALLENLYRRWFLVFSKLVA